MSDKITQPIWGGNELAKQLVGRRVTDVDLTGGWIDLTLDDGSRMHISAELGASLSLDYDPPPAPQ